MSICDRRPAARYNFMHLDDGNHNYKDLYQECKCNGCNSGKKITDTLYYTDKITGRNIVESTH